MSWPDVFFSLRYAEAKAEALQIQAALKEVGISSYICQTLAGNDIVDDILNHMKHAKLAVIMGSKTYGAEGTTKFTTKEELTMIRGEDMPFVLVKMCDKFEEYWTRFYLPATFAYVKWNKGESMPANLVSKIKEKLAAVDAGGGEAPAVPRKAHVSCRAPACRCHVGCRIRVRVVHGAHTYFAGSALDGGRRGVFFLHSCCREIGHTSRHGNHAPLF